MLIIKTRGTVLKKLSSVIAAAFLLTACKVDIDTQVNLQDVQSMEHKVVNADLNFEVASCTDHEDSRKESKSLVKVKEKVPTVFKNATYVECYRKKFNSFAHFQVPVDVGATGQDAKYAMPDADIFITSTKEKGILASLYLSEDVRKRIDAARKENVADFNFNVRINMKKGSEPVHAIVAGVYLENSKGKQFPIIVEKVNWVEDIDMTFVLGDVAKSRLFGSGFFALLSDPSTLPK